MLASSKLTLENSTEGLLKERALLHIRESERFLKSGSSMQQSLKDAQGSNEWSQRKNFRHLEWREQRQLGCLHGKKFFKD